VAKYAEMRADLTVLAQHWHEARPRIAGHSESLKRISSQINREISHLSRLIDAAEGHERSGRRILAMWTTIRALDAMRRISRLSRRIDSMIP
jgi:hypothetical protein